MIYHISAKTARRNPWKKLRSAARRFIFRAGRFSGFEFDFSVRPVYKNIGLVLLVLRKISDSGGRS
jgi:hypothetical protein